MGREVKRVPLDFNWPLHKVWGGYKNPFYGQAIECPECKGSGSAPGADHLKDLWYGYAPFKPEDRGSRSFQPSDKIIMAMAERNVPAEPSIYPELEDWQNALKREAERLADLFNSEWMHHLNQDDVNALIEAGRLMDLTHIWTQGKGWQPKDPPYVPTAREVNEWSIRGFGHDSVNQWVVANAECKRLGIDPTCPRCKGEGSLWPTPEIKKQYEEWKQTEPPTGDGYQIWETVSEGSPISPVFEKPEDLAEWMEKNGTHCDKGTTKEQWLKFILGPGWAPSFIGGPGGLKTGVEAVP